MFLVEKLKKIILGCRYETAEDLRHRGVRVGEDVAVYSSDIDGGFGFLIDIGNHVTITNATILAHDASTKRSLGYSKVGRVKIGDYVFVGYGSIILPGVTIGDHVIVGAGTIVREDIPDNCVVIGNPGKVVCSTEEYIKKNSDKLEKSPRYESYWKDKNETEKNQMREDLQNTIGFNV